MRTGVVLIGTLAALLVLAGCGGSSESTDAQTARFEARGFGITFGYPPTMKQVDDLILGTTSGATDAARAGVGIDRHNVIMVTRYDLQRAVTEENVETVKAEIDDVIGNLAGRPAEGRRVDFGELPGYAYRVPLGTPKGGVSRLFVLFDNQVEYFFNCQSTPTARVQLDGACDQALRSLERV